MTRHQVEFIKTRWWYELEQDEALEKKGVQDRLKWDSAVKL